MESVEQGDCGIILFTAEFHPKGIFLQTAPS